MKHLIFFLCAIIVVSAQQESKAKLRSKLKSEDFVFNLAMSQPDAQSAGGVSRTATLDNFPALSGEGLSQRLFNINPCGINDAQVHPRASEILYAIDAEDLQVGFVEENGGRVLVNRISSGFSTIIPRGLIHYQINLSCKKATYVSAYSSEDPGFISVMPQTLLFPNYVLSGTLGIAESEVDKLRNGLPKSPSLSLQQSECYKRCGLTEASPGLSIPGPSNIVTFSSGTGSAVRWAPACDWSGNDFDKKQVVKELCGRTCLERDGCTHFTWTRVDRGTCFLKEGFVLPTEAFTTSDKNNICGYSNF
jgi:oxalate decarboxylase/phosphoglucose isomerase-like protein (cupin superfamily)